MPSSALSTPIHHLALSNLQSNKLSLGLKTDGAGEADGGLKVDQLWPARPNSASSLALSDTTSAHASIASQKENIKTRRRRKRQPSASLTQHLYLLPHCPKTSLLASLAKSLHSAKNMPLALLAQNCVLVKDNTFDLFSMPQGVNFDVVNGTNRTRRRWPIIWHAFSMAK